MDRIEPRQRPIVSQCREMRDQFAFLFGGGGFQFGNAWLEVLGQRTLLGQDLHRTREATDFRIDPNLGQLLTDARNVVE